MSDNGEKYVEIDGCEFDRYFGMGLDHRQRAKDSASAAMQCFAKAVDGDSSSLAIGLVELSRAVQSLASIDDRPRRVRVTPDCFATTDPAPAENT